MSLFLFRLRNKLASFGVAILAGRCVFRLGLFRAVSSATGSSSLFLYTLCILIGVGAALNPDQAMAYDPQLRHERSTEKPKELEQMAIKEKLGEKIDLNLTFTDEAGQLVPLSTYFTGNKPVLLAIIYYSCPNLCNYQLNGLLDTLKTMKGKAGVDYELVTVSMNHKETPDLASKKKDSYMKALGQPGAEKGWHLLVGTEENIKKLADQVGFGFRWDEGNQQYAHSAAMYVLTPTGVISRYLYGIEFPPQTLRLSLIEASNNKIGTFMEHVVLYCFQWDPTRDEYVIAAFRVMQAGAAFTVLVLAIFLVPVWMRERQRKAPVA